MRKSDGDENTMIGPAKGGFVPPPEVEERDERADALPPQEEFWKTAAIEVE